MDARKAIRVLEKHDAEFHADVNVHPDYSEAVAALKELVPKRYEVVEATHGGPFAVDPEPQHPTRGDYCAHHIPTREAAEAIAAIYEEAAE